VETAAYIYWRADYDRTWEIPVIRRRGTPEFNRATTEYTRNDPCGRARWERLNWFISEIARRRTEVQEALPELRESMAQRRRQRTDQQGQTSQAREEALAWMDRMEESTIRMYQADFERIYLALYQQRRADPVFDEAMRQYRFNTEEGIRRWNQIVEWTVEAERWKRECNGPTRSGQR
jgi:hypothetical protein